MENYNHQEIEQKWQRLWEETKIYQANDFDPRPKQYILIEFPYLSGDGLHVGHVRSYSALDALSRKKRMEGYNVLYPIGWDAFGLPTENYALKTGIHPIDITKKNIELFKRQLKGLGLSFDWSREINTSDPDYYRWTQWIFLKFYEKGLAYVAEIPINWCPSCKIGLANEEVINGKCERCGASVEKQEKKQWMMKITAYADRLLQDLETVDYLDKIKTQQINWIGRSQGTVVKFKISGNSRALSASHQFIEVFTTRIDTLFGVTALVLAPEHKFIIDNLSLVDNRQEVEKYIKASKKKSELERTDLDKEKTGAPLKGVYALNPINGEKVPVWVGDYVIATYGGGAVMVVPAHDKRDYALAQKYGLEIRQVIKTPKQKEETKKESEQAFTDYGFLVNSGEFNGLPSEKAIEKITDWLERRDLGGKAIHYKLRDWVFSRQHYWGEPIPLIFCENCKKLAEKFKIQNSNSEIKKEFSQGEILNPGWIAVPEKDLPVELPYVKKYQPSQTGESPLANIKEWVETKCPKCGRPARRETDTMPNWAGSNWYFLAYCLATQMKEFKSAESFQNIFLKNKDILNYWLPVDVYNGGMEHTTLHLLYSRFWHKFLFDLGLVPNPEPYARRRSHGMVLAEDGRKMSKSFGNVINPDEIVAAYGADVLRVYEMFMGPFDQAIAWDTKTIKGVDRFLAKVRNLILKIKNKKQKIQIKDKEISKTESDKLEQLKHQTIKKVSQDLDNLRFNTAVAALMEYVNQLSAASRLSTDHFEALILLLAPLAPHLSEELWHQLHPDLSEKQSVFQEKWPEFDEESARQKQIELIIQINGKIRDKIAAEVDISESEAKKIAFESPKIQKYLMGKEIKKIIFVPGKLINLCT